MMSKLKCLNIKKSIFCLLVFCLLPTSLIGQHKISFKDSLDHKLDLSDWVISTKGFIPVPVLITEPALGGLGGGLFPVLFSLILPMLIL